MKFGETDEDRAKVTGKLAVRHLVHDSPLPALALQSQLRKTSQPVSFPGQATYERIASEENLFVETVIQPRDRGFEHVLFLTKVQGLSESELMSCRRPRTFNRHDPTGPGEPI